jgi:hypothetical protein
VSDYNLFVPTNAHIILLYITLPGSYMFRLVAILFACEPPDDDDQPKHAGARYGEICISIICAFVGTRIL